MTEGFVPGPDEVQEAVGTEAADTGQKMPSRYRLGLSGVVSRGRYGSQVPTHSREPGMSPAEHTAQLEADLARWRQLEANRPPKERQAHLDAATKKLAQDAFAKLTVDQQVSALQAAGVDFERPLVPEFAVQAKEPSEEAKPSS